MYPVLDAGENVSFQTSLWVLMFSAVRNRKTYLKGLQTIGKFSLHNKESSTGKLQGWFIQWHNNVIGDSGCFHFSALSYLGGPTQTNPPHGPRIAARVPGTNMQVSTGIQDNDQKEKRDYFFGIYFLT